MGGPNKKPCFARSRVGQAAVPIAHLVNKLECPQECNGISWLALCSSRKVSSKIHSLNVSVEGRHSDNEAVAAGHQQQP